LAGLLSLEEAFFLSVGERLELYSKTKNQEFQKVAETLDTIDIFGGAQGIRTPDLLHAKQALSQLS
jgi:hypothetical protein